MLHISRMLSDSRPIAVFDSGIGGLTVVAALMEALPQESFVYLGDTARLPYGNKTPETLIKYSLEIAQFLLKQNVKAIVVACNTASAYALSHLQAAFDVPVLGVIEPGAKAALRVTRSKHIGVIGTYGTIKSNAYEQAITALDKAAKVYSQACPLFVPLVEEAWLEEEASELIARKYLSAFDEYPLDTLVLGCTHYPLLIPLLRKVIGEKVRLVSSAAACAEELKELLQEKALLADVHKKTCRILTTDHNTWLESLVDKILPADLNAKIETVSL